MKIKIIFSLLYFILFSSAVMAQKFSQNKNNLEHNYISKKDFIHIRMMINLPLKNRNQALFRYGSKSFSILKSFVFSSQESMPIRWKSLTSLARLYPQKSEVIIQKTLRSSEWFLRNAGLISLEIVNPKASVRQAYYFLNDPSLIIRTAAVDLIKKHKARQYKIFLLQKLNAPDSFYKKSSLWIRYHIVSALAELYESGEEEIFISFLNDLDTRLHTPSIIALQKLTGKTFSVLDLNNKNALKIRKQKWIQWWATAPQNRKSVYL